MPFIDADTVVALGDMLVSRAKECKPDSYHRDAEYQSALSGALIAFQTALNINPQNVRCLMGLGDIHLVRGEDHEARKKYQEAIAAEPSDAEAYVKLASTYGTKFFSSDSSDTDGKIREIALRKALECDPQHVGALIRLGDILLDRATSALDKNEEYEQFVDEAGSLYGAALAIKPDNYASYEALCHLISFLSHSGGHSKNSTLKLLWSLTKSNEHLKKLCVHEFAKLEQIHLGQLPTISDLVFNVVAGNASSATGLFSISAWPRRARFLLRPRQQFGTGCSLTQSRCSICTWSSARNSGMSS
ncbi:tetratricopeptide repeat domain containing protein [Acanthamoeba castellanii str. Neff]|uniref:Tetratricopeptide repeat domain containing protein n=1 Tax=Acanthamoeba castellanii (strain ATCC 30010 / Neff) TaxID=1257118 RepID=L8GF20_ACACF|nr:tetratricopeptide repeat domain containing protein [Acanthamoeba castellanii str. Neff]ELR11469.1 tetratricopeptide repeat domain containing protein [Acanthamoeba castellanii str. Neff]